MRKLLLITFTAFFICACSSDPSSSSNTASSLNETPSETSSCSGFESSSSEEPQDTIAYVEPPKLYCKVPQIKYLIDNIVATPDTIVAFYADYGSFFYKKGKNEFLFDTVCALIEGVSHCYQNDGYSFEYQFADTRPVLKNGILVMELKKRHTPEDYGNYDFFICRSTDLGENITCNLQIKDTSAVVILNDGEYFYTQLGKELQYSKDGFDWTAISYPQNLNTGKATSAFMKGSTHYVYLSATWAEPGTGSNYGPSYLLSSEDMVTWDTTFVPPNCNLSEIAYGNDVFVQTGIDGKISYSKDLKTWNKVHLYDDNSSPWIEAIVFAKDMFVLVGTAGSNSLSKSVYASYNGKDFAKQEACGAKHEYTSITFDGYNQFYVTYGYSVYSYVTFQTEPY